jgi:hypothetical protein
MSTITLAEVSALCSAMIEAEREVELEEEALKAAKERVRQLKEESIPMAMQELGIDSMKLTTGQKVSIKQDVYAAIPAAQRGEAYAWLEDNGFGGLIKTNVSVQFGKGEMDNAKNAITILQKVGLAPELTQSVHAQTLCAFLREQLADAESSKALPLDLFGARPCWTTKISK